MTSVRKNDEKARFRNTSNNQFRKDPSGMMMGGDMENGDDDEYGEERDELESVISNNYNQMLMHEFKGKDGGMGGRRRKKKGKKPAAER